MKSTQWRRLIGAGLSLSTALAVAGCSGTSSSPSATSSSSAAAGATTGAATSGAATSGASAPTSGAASSGSSTASAGAATAAASASGPAVPVGTDATSKAIAAVTDAQLKGVTIHLSRFFGDCSATVGSNTDLTKAVGECPTITTLTNMFNATNQWGIKVDRLGGAAWDSYYDTLNAAIAGGNPPDVAIMHGSSLVDYAKRKLLLPVDGLVGITGINLADAVPAAKIAIGYNGADYAVPFDVHAALAQVNVDLFKAAGLVNADGTAKLPTSTAEFLADAAAVKKATGKAFIAVPRVGDELGVHLFESLLGQQGSDVLSPDGNTATLDTPQARTALAFMSQVFSNGYADGNLTTDAADQSFVNGNAAILFNGTWLVDSNRTTVKFKYEADSFPTLFGKPAVWADSHTWTIPVQPKPDPVKYRAALDFITFLYAHDKDWALGTGHISARQSVLASAAYKAAPQRANYASTGTTVAHPIPHIANWPAVDKALVAAMGSIWFQHVSVDAALKRGQAAITAALHS